MKRVIFEKPDPSTILISSPEVLFKQYAFKGFVSELGIRYMILSSLSSKQCISVDKDHLYYVDDLSIPTNLRRFYIFNTAQELYKWLHQ